MEISISTALENKGFDPAHLVTHLRQTIRAEREIFDTQKKYLTTKELHDHEVRITNMEKLLVTLLIEAL